MKVVFKAESLTFNSDFNGSLTARQLLGQLPLHSYVKREEAFLSIDVPVHAVFLGSGNTVKAGDIVFVPYEKKLYVFLRDTLLEPDGKPLFEGKWVVVGTTLALPEELHLVAEKEKIELEISAEPSLSDSRKLSQDEIDVLIKSVLAKK